MSTERNVKTRQEYTLDEWQAEAARRFGPAQEGNWSFVCPACGNIQSPASIKASGYGDPNWAYEECYGRGTRKDLAKRQGKPKGQKGDCDWKAYGLFAGPVTVITPDGQRVHVFDFAQKTAEVPPGFVMPTPQAAQST